jgi:4-diphosphocytidyl-2-C-methyl-D-erythritol kinase
VLSVAVLEQTASAKVNLFLHVVGRRPDGYHLLDSLVVFPAVGDTLRGTAAQAFSLALEGPFGGALPDGPDNLVLRAARGMAELTGTGIGARLTLVKSLPVASGIGGGSADAAAALHLLGRLWGVAPAAEALEALALRLGADVPVCLAGRPARMGGIGEVLSPAPGLPAFGLVLVNPGVAVSTPAVFRARVGRLSAPAVLPSAWPDAVAMARDLAALGNDLEPPAVALCPVIGEVLAALRTRPGCLLTRMSGSGATCFGLFTDAAGAIAAAGTVRRPGWWVWGGAC